VTRRARAAYEVVVAVVSVAGGVEEGFCSVVVELALWSVDEEVEAVSGVGAEGVVPPDTSGVEVELTKGGAFSMYVPLGWAA
jgi:hypothetical protein